MDKIKAIAEKRLKPRHEENFIDRTNYATTSFILAIAAIAAFTKEFGPFSEPIYCWSQAEWNDQWMDYAHDYCFIESTYYVPLNQTIPMRNERNNARDQVGYYQWLPFILLLMALFCQFPHKLWLFINACSDKSLPVILRQSHDAVGKGNELRVAAGIGRHLYTTLSKSNDNRSMVRMAKWKIKQLAGNLLCPIYLLMKLLFLAVNIGQFVFIIYFLGPNQTPGWGIQMIETFIKYGSAWEHNSLFPRISLCDFKIRMPGNNISNYTVQCVLAANFLNEKIFLILYYWFSFMALLTAFDFLCWCWSLFFCSGVDYIGRLVELSAAQIHPDPEWTPKMAASEEKELMAMIGSADMVDEADKEESADEFIPGHIFTVSSTSNSSSSASASSSSSSFFHHDNVSPVISNATTRTYISNNDNVEQQRESEGSAGTRNDRPLSSNNSDKPPPDPEISEWKEKLSQAQKKRGDFYQAYRNHRYGFMEMLGCDGILISRLIRVNAGQQMASLVMGELFSAYLEGKYDVKEKMTSGKQQRIGLVVPPV